MYIIGNLIVYWIIFRMLIIVRIPYKLDKSISLLQMYIILTIILGSLLEIKILVNKWQNKQERSLMQRLLTKYMTKYYLQSLQAFQQISHASDLLKKPLSHLLNYGETLKYITYYLYFYARVFIIISLCIDVFYLHEVLVFYKMLYLLIIPLTFNGVFSMIQEHSTNTLQHFEIKMGVFISNKNPHYHITINNVTLSQQVKTSILEKCRINLEVLNVIHNINEIKNSNHFILVQLLLFLMFCFLWSYTFLNIILNSKP